MHLDFFLTFELHVDIYTQIKEKNYICFVA